MIHYGRINYSLEEIEYSNKEMKLRINNADYERGELIITKREIAWKKENSDSQGFSIPWEKIVVQAISSENQRSIYFMIDCLWPNNQPNQIASNGSSNNGSNLIDNGTDDEEYIDCDDEVSEITEFWMVPDDIDEVDNIYYAMTRFPENVAESEEEDEDENFLDGEDMEQMNINDDERFADD